MQSIPKSAIGYSKTRAIEVLLVSGTSNMALRDEHHEALSQNSFDTMPGPAPKQQPPFVQKRINAWLCAFEPLSRTNAPASPAKEKAFHDTLWVPMPEIHGARDKTHAIPRRFAKELAPQKSDEEDGRPLCL